MSAMKSLGQISRQAYQKAYVPIKPDGPLDLFALDLACHEAAARAVAEVVKKQFVLALLAYDYKYPANVVERYWHDNYTLQAEGGESAIRYCWCPIEDWRDLPEGDTCLVCKGKVRK